MIVDLYNARINITASNLEQKFEEALVQLIHPFKSETTNQKCKADFYLEVTHGFKPITEVEKSFKNNECRLAEQNGKITLTTSNSFAVLDVSNNKMIVTHHSKDVFEFQKNVVEHLKLVASIILTLRGGLPLHSSAVSRKNKAFLFLGPSGAGKSTISQLLKGSWQVIDEEFNVIIRENVNYFVSTLPQANNMAGFTVCNEKPALDGIFLLEKSNTNNIKNMPHRIQCASLLSHLFIFPLSQTIGDALLSNVDHVLEKMPILNLQFRNDHSICSFLDNWNKKNVL
ncbi:MAG: hypothetical protein GF398_19740 [Chitinivibrionales bacterium]|nr:hypothetical protein [Chitinivibrionales bacterium]